MYDSLYGLATRSTPRTPLTLCTVKTGTSIYQTRLDRPQLPATIIQLHPTTQPTATRIKHLAVSPPLDLRQLPSSNIQLRTSTMVVNLTINRHFCCICYLAFVSFIVFGCHYSHALNLKHLRGRHAYQLRNNTKPSRQVRLTYKLLGLSHTVTHRLNKDIKIDNCDDRSLSLQPRNSSYPLEPQIQYPIQSTAMRRNP